MRLHFHLAGKSCQQRLWCVNDKSGTLGTQEHLLIMNTLVQSACVLVEL